MDKFIPGQEVMFYETPCIFLEAGVSQTLDKKWHACINKNKKRITLYTGDSKEEAIRKRLQAEIEFLPKHLWQKHLFKQYGVEYNE